MDPNEQQAPVQNNDDQEWATAGEAFSAERGISVAPPEKVEPPKGDNNEPAKPAQGAESQPATQTNPENKEQDAKSGDGDDATKEAGRDRNDGSAKEEDNNEPVEVKDDPAARDTRQVQRQIAEHKKTVAEDIRKNMFAEVKTELTDADGDPIRTVEDVQRLINPNTGKAFTPQEATLYLFQAQKHLEDQLKEVDDQVEQIAETNLTLQDESDIIRTEYGEILANVPGLQQKLWNEYKKTLTYDEKSEVIIKAPVSLRAFYETALKPYKDYMAKVQNEEKSEAAVAAVAEKKKSQSDRSDIFAGGKTDTMEPEEKEWASAAKQYYES